MGVAARFLWVWSYDLYGCSCMTGSVVWPHDFGGSGDAFRGSARDWGRRACVMLMAGVNVIFRRPSAISLKLSVPPRSQSSTCCAGMSGLARVGAVCVRAC